MVIDTTDERHSEAMAVSVIAVLIGQDFENFQFRVDVLYQDPFSGDSAIIGLVFFGQRVLFRLFLWCLTVCVEFSNALESTVSLDVYLFSHTTADRIFIHLEIMCLACVLIDSDNFIGLAVYKNQGFYGVLFLFP